MIPSLRTPVVIEKPRSATSSDAFNQVDYSDADNWIELFTRRAEVRPVTGREYQSANSIVGETSHIVTMRRDPETVAITLKHRLRIGVGVSARYLNIVRIIDIEERHRWLELQCLEQVA